MIPLRIITHNIRYATTHPIRGEKPWSDRCPRLCAQLNFTSVGHDGAFICLQEVLSSQLLDIQSYLGPSWAHLGVGRDDGKDAGEFSPIFFQVHKWRCIRSKTYWLSKTPEVPSKGWDAVLNRVVTMGSFEHKATGAQVVVMSTHFDHVGVIAREESAKLLMQLAKSWISGDNGSVVAPPVFIGGDFNSTPDDRAYRAITASGSGWFDVSTAIPESQRHGNWLTYTSFGEPGETAKRIDFIFTKEHPSVKFVTFGVLANRFDDDVYLSDHCAVVADMQIPVSLESF